MDLTAGQNVPLPADSLSLRLFQPPDWQADLVALLLDAQGQVSADADFIFYNAARHPSGAVALDGPLLRVNLEAIPPTVERIVVAADRGVSGDLDGVAIALEGGEPLTFRPPGLSGLSTVVLLEVYRRGEAWRLRAVGQGWSSGLAGLARDYGVNVEAPGEGDGGSPPLPDPPAASHHSSTEHRLEPLTARRDALLEELAGLEQKVSAARAALVETDELRLLQQAGYYQFRHPLDDVLTSKRRLDALRAHIKTAITKRTAVRGTSGWMVNGSSRRARPWSASSAT